MICMGEGEVYFLLNLGIVENNNAGINFLFRYIFLASNVIIMDTFFFSEDTPFILNRILFGLPIDILEITFI